MDNWMRFETSMLISMALLSACSKGPSLNLSKTFEAWNGSNDPSHFAEWSSTASNPEAYERVFERLPLHGELDATPWSGDYWPTHRGGISFRWAGSEDLKSSYNYMLRPFETLTDQDVLLMSPAEKYDLFRGDSNYSLTHFERQRTKVLETVPEHESYLPDFKIPTWEGLCHAWAPASLFYKSPNPVTLTGKLGHTIPFGASDVQALLSLFLDQNMKDDGDYIGDRCESHFAAIDKQFARGLITRFERNRLKSTDSCRDTNAGSFHLALTNEIGIRNQGFIMDLVRDSEVWNHPIFKFESKIVRQVPRASRGSAEGTVSEVELETSVSYMGSGDYAFEQDLHETYVKTVLYRYKLELDENGSIIGGAWVSDNQPDFIWKGHIPEFSGYFAPLEFIYRASVETHL